MYLYTSMSIYLHFQLLFPYRLLHNIEYSSLCYTVGHCWLTMLCIVVCICKSHSPQILPNIPFSLLGLTSTLLLFSSVFPPSFLSSLLNLGSPFSYIKPGVKGG